jgi:hypothetical protein
MFGIDVGIPIPQLLAELMAWLKDHPVVLGLIGLAVLLAVVGAWYVVTHHLHALLITLLCAAGFASGAIVLYRGIQSDMRDLVTVGLFLLLIFPVIYLQAIRIA